MALFRMEKLYEDSPLRIVPLHKHMPLYRMVDGKKTNRKDLLNGFKDAVFRSLSHNTAKNYVSNIKRLIKPLSFESPKISVKDIKEFLSEKGLPSHAAVKMFLELCEDIFNKRFDIFKYPKIKKYKPLTVVTLTEEQIKRIIDSLPSEFKFLCTIQYYLGLRISEPFYIKLNQFNWGVWMDNKSKNGSVIIKVAKGGKQRKIPINSDLMKSIYEFIFERDGGVYPNVLLFDFNHDKYIKKRFRRHFRRRLEVPIFWENIEEYKELLMQRIEKTYVETNIKKYCKEFSRIAKETLNIDCASHILRKSRATNMLKAGVPIIQVKSFLGHEKVETTMKYLQSDYSDLDETMLKLKL